MKSGKLPVKMKNIIKIVLMFLLFILALASVLAVDRFISVNGSDSNNGQTPGTAWLTVDKAFANWTSDGLSGNLYIATNSTTTEFNDNSGSTFTGSNMHILPYNNARPKMMLVISNFYSLTTTWTSENSTYNVWTAGFATGSTEMYATENSTKEVLYVYPDNASAHNASQPNYGIRFEGTPDVIYLRMNDTRNPNSIPFLISKNDGWTVTGSSNLIIEGMAFYGGQNCIKTTSGSGLQIINNTFYCAKPLSVQGIGNVTIKDNVIFEKHGNYSWQHTKDYSAANERTAIYIINGLANITVSGNIISGFYNGIYTQASAITQFPSLQVIYNNISDVYDDAIEIENFHNGGNWSRNKINDSYVAVSVSPAAGTTPRSLIEYNVLDSRKNIWFSGTGTFNTAECFKILGTTAASNFTINHNTCIGRGTFNASQPTYLRDTNWTNNLIVTNSTYGRALEGSGLYSNGVIWDYNLYHSRDSGALLRWMDSATNSTSYNTLAAYKATAGYNGVWEVHGLNQDPLFYNFDANDFRPNSTSAVCTAASDGTYLGALACADVVAPGNITNVTIPSYNNQSIYLFWTNPSDSDLNHTEIYANGVFITNATGNSYNVTGLTSDTSYNFVLRPVDYYANRGNNASINGTTLANSFTPGGCELTITRFTSQATLFNTTLSNSSRMYNVTFCQKPYIVNATITVQNFNTSNNITLNETNAPTCTGSVTGCANAYDDNFGTSASISIPGTGYAYHNYENIFSHKTNISIYYSCGASASTLSLDCSNVDYLNLFTENAPCGTSFRELNLQQCDNGGAYQFRTYMDASFGGSSQLIDIIPRYYFAHNITANNLSIHSDYYAGRQTKTINFTSAARNTSSTVMYVNLSYIGNITWQSNITLDIVYNKTINVSIRSASNTSQILNPTCTYNGNTVYPYSTLLNYTSSLSNALACNASGYSDATFDIVPVADAFNLTMSSATLFLTILDEETDRQISENVTLTVLSSQSIVNYTVIAGGINISSLPNGEIELRYGSGLYVVRSYFATISSNTSIDLYTLKNTSATLILFYIPDERGNPVFNGTLKMQRQFANRSDIWRTVAMEKIDDNGISGIYLVANDVYYKFLIEKAGVMLATYGPQKVFSSPVTLQAPTLENVLRSLVSVRDSITTSLVWNNVTNVVTYTWNDASGITQQGCLEVFQITAFARQSKASSCGSSAAGSIDINTTSFLINATYQARGYIVTSTTYSEPITDILFKVFGRQHDTYGRFGLYAAYLLIGTLFLAGLFFSFSMALIFSGVGMFFAQAIGLAFFGPQLIVTFLIIGFVIAVANRI